MSVIRIECGYRTRQAECQHLFNEDVEISSCTGEETRVNAATLLQREAKLIHFRLGWHILRRNRIVYFAFDLLWLNGEDLRELPLLERKKLLRSMIPRKPSCIGYVGFVDRQADRLFELVKTNDLEGLVVKRKDGKYRPQTKWFKVVKSQLLAKSRTVRAV